MTSKNLSAPTNSAPEPPEAPGTVGLPAAPQEPTTYLPDPEESAFFDAPSSGSIYLPEQDEPAPRTLLTQSQFSRERQQDEADALSSLDDTVLRPPLDIPFNESGNSAQPGPASAQPSSPAAPTAAARAPRHTAPYLAVAATLLVACLVGLRAQGSRVSSVGLFGLPAQPAAEVTADTTSQVTQPVAPLSQLEGDEPEATPDPEPEADASPADRYPWLTYTSPYGNTETGYEDDPSPDQWFTYDDEAPTSSDADEPLFTWDYDLDDDRSLSLTFDGGNLTYYYDDELLTLDLDELDWLLGDGEVWDTHDGWGYGGSPHGHGGSSYYSYGGPRGW